jgi:hypothetical protein
MKRLIPGPTHRILAATALLWAGCAAPADGTGGGTDAEATGGGETTPDASVGGTGGMPVGGTPVGGTPVGGTPVGGTPVGGAGGEPIGGTGGTPAGGAGGEPVGGSGGTPVGGAGGEPVGGAGGGMGCEPAAERCNGLDDDCNGTIDDGFGVGDPCLAGVGACAGEGTFVCDETGEAVCNAPTGPAMPEVCDGLDNDCNGIADDDVLGIGEPCQVGDGVCAGFGSIGCTADGMLACDGLASDPSDEVCDGLDNDCNAVVDDAPGTGAPCVVGEGACRAQGVLECGPAGGLTCAGQPGDPQPEVCDEVDNDCDGIVDNAPDGCGPADPCIGVECPEGQFCAAGLCVTPPGSCDGVECGRGQFCNLGACVDAVALGGLTGFGHHGECASWNQCNDAATCAAAACRYNGFGNAVAWSESNCLGVEGLDCNLFNELGVTLDTEWVADAACDIPVAYDVYCAAVTLDGSVRLAGGASPESGRVEIAFGGAWGTVCDDSFDLIDADVVCHQLGFRGAASVQSGFGGGADPIWLDEVACMGQESSLAQCSNNGLAVHDCGHGEDVGVTCLLPGQCVRDGQCNEAEVCDAGACVPDPCLAVECPAGLSCDGGVCVGGIPLPALEGYGHHGSCETWNGCGDAQTCANAACHYNGYGDALTFNQAGCSDVPGLFCKLFAELPGNLDAEWGGGCNIPVAYGIVCAPSSVELGGFQVLEGPMWSDPGYKSVSCVEACAQIHGGDPGQYGCSTVPGELNHRAYVDGWGDSQFCQGEGVADDFSLPVGGLYDCGMMGCSYSAYVNDHGCAGTNYCWRLGAAPESNRSCANNPLWRRAECQIDSWLWSSDSSVAQDVDAAEAASVLYSGCRHSGDSNDEGLCTLDGQGWVSVDAWDMLGCDASWYHLGGQFSGQCGGHDGDRVRRVVRGDQGCYDYRDLPNPGALPPPVLQ